jgi:hypothetical protein
MRGISTSPDEFFTEHLPYEISMMRGSIEVLSTPLLGTFATNAFIETFCLHARNLIEFFRNKEGCEFDPQDFTTAAFEVKTAFIGNGPLQWINKQVSHLTKGRTKDPAEKINTADIAEMNRAIEAEIERFLRHLTPERRAMWEANADRIVPVRKVPATLTAMCSTSSFSITSILFEAGRSSDIGGTAS